MSKNKFYAIVIVGLLISNGILVFFMSQKDHRRKPPRSPKEIVIKRLNFDESQIALYNVLIEGHGEKMHELMKSIRESRNDLYSKILDDDKSNVQASLIESIARNQGQLEQLNYSHFQDIKSLCMPNQLDDFEELSKDLAKIFGKGKGKPKHRPKR